MRKHGKINWSILAVTILLITGLSGYAWAQNEVSVSTEINIEHDCADSEAELVIRIIIPEGTPVGTLPEVIEKLQSLYKDLWTGEKPLPLDANSQGGVPEGSEKDPGPRAVIGVDAILAVTRAYHGIEERGLSVFPESSIIVSKEKFPLTIECLLSGDINDKDEKIKAFQEDNLLKMKREHLVQNLNYMAVTLVSFRSEFNRFPADLNELFESGHVMIDLRNPFTGKMLDFAKNNMPGNVVYSRPADGRYCLTALDTADIQIRRELLVGPATQTKGILSYDRPMGKDAVPYNDRERKVRIYIFQLGNLLNSFYENNNYLPDNIPHIEVQGYSSVSFVNPFTKKPVEPCKDIKTGDAGDYSYWKIGETEYLLVGYGTGGRKVIEIHRRFIGNLD